QTRKSARVPASSLASAGSGVELGQALCGLAEAVPGLGEVRPGIGAAVEPGPDRLYRELAGPQGVVFHFGPVQRGGHGRALAAPHAVAGHHRLRVGVAHDVGVDPVPPLVLALLGGDGVRVPAGQHLGYAVRELADVLEVRPPVQAHVDVQAPAAGGPDEAGQAEFAVQQVACPQCGPPDLGEPLAIRRVEVEHHLVGRVKLVHPAGEPVDLDAGLVGQVDQGGGLVADRVLD